MPRRFWVETLGCPKNQVDSDKLTGSLLADGMLPADDAGSADLVVVNTCAFIEAARQESIDTVLELSDRRAAGAELVVTGCLAARYRDELAEALPEVDVVAGFGESLTGADVPTLDLLRLPRPASAAPWAYLKVAEGCDRACGFCAIPSFRGPQRSRPVHELLDEVDDLDVREVVLVAQDLAAYGRDVGHPAIVELVREVTARVEWVRLLYLYPSDLTDELIEAVLATEVPYFDLSLQHVSRPLLRRMRRWGDAERFAQRIAAIRAARPDAVFRTNFILGYPGETEADQAALLEFVAETRLDWCGLFTYSPEDGTYAMGLDAQVPTELAVERLAEVREVADRITEEARDALIGTTIEVLVDAPGQARSWREAPEIDGIVEVPDTLAVGDRVAVSVERALGPDLVGTPIGPVDPWVRR